MSGEGILQWTDDTELGAWAAAAAVRAAVAGLAAGDAALDTFQDAGAAGTPPAAFQVRAGLLGLHAEQRAALHGPACDQQSQLDTPHPRLPPPLCPPLQCRTELGVLPADHPQRTEGLLRRVIASVEAGDAEAAGRQLDDLLEGAVEQFGRGAWSEQRAVPVAGPVACTA